jgi:malto-oligosyltrehalose trehalohydrolase
MPGRAVSRRLRPTPTSSSNLQLSRGCVLSLEHVCSDFLSNLSHAPRIHSKVISEEKRTWELPFGAALQPGGVRFRVWAPEMSSLQLALEDQPAPLAMERDAEGWFELTTPLARAGSRYRFLLPTGLLVPDPASRFQPEDVNGPSEVIDPGGYEWRVHHWTCCTWDRAILYELHIGTFTPQGTFLAAIEKLDHLVQLGITAIEIMSLGDFPGRWNWGYDGVLLYAPDSSYGRPEELKQLVDAAHQRGLMVLLDVVYNHFGPEGNYIGQYFPDVVTREYQTPWGQALNFDAKHSEQTRELIVNNALYWIREFRMDGLRLDAVHAIFDRSSLHILDEIAQAARRAAGDRPIHLILESDDRVLHHLVRNEGLAPVSSTAQWNHDSQKLLALALTSNRTGQQDYEETLLLCRALTEGFTSGPHHRNAPESAGQLRIGPAGFISFLQTHDVVGNRIRGERISDLAPAHVVRAIASVYLLAPQVPMLFMGEEWGASSPFPFFCDFSGELRDAVRNGRLEQFATPEQRADLSFVASVPDPLGESTFLSAKLHWDELAGEPHASLLHWYQRALAARKKHILPHLLRLHSTDGEFVVPGPRQLRIRWRLSDIELILEANLSSAPSSVFEPPAGDVFWLEGSSPDARTLDAWSVRWALLQC